MRQSPFCFRKSLHRRQQLTTSAPITLQVVRNVDATLGCDENSALGSVSHTFHQLDGELTQRTSQVQNFMQQLSKVLAK